MTKIEVLEKKLINAKYKNFNEVFKRCGFNYFDCKKVEMTVIELAHMCLLRNFLNKLEFDKLEEETLFVQHALLSNEIDELKIKVEEILTKVTLDQYHKINLISVEEGNYNLTNIKKTSNWLEKLILSTRSSRLLKVIPIYYAYIDKILKKEEIADIYAIPYKEYDDFGLQKTQKL